MKVCDFITKKFIDNVTLKEVFVELLNDDRVEVFNDIEDISEIKYSIQNQKNDGEFKGLISLYFDDVSLDKRRIFNALEQTCLFSSDNINPYEMILVDGLGESIVYLDVEKLDKLNQYCVRKR